MKKSVAVLISGAICFIFICAKNPLTPYKFPDLLFFPEIPVSPENPVSVEGADLGRYLFYDPVLSSDSSISCSSCHNQQLAFSDSPNQFSIGVNKGKTERNAMPLFNLNWYPLFFYDGRAENLEDQISHPLMAKNEMNMKWDFILKKLNANKFYTKKFRRIFHTEYIDSTKVKKAIAQFLKTLISHESKFDLVQTGKRKFTKEEFNGFRLMNNQTKGDCLHCHPTDGNGLITTMKFSDNGLEQVKNASEYKDRGRGAVTGNTRDNGKFMIPSLRNIALTAPYMHDGRFKTLDEVLNFYSTGVHVSVNIDSKMEYAYQGGVKLTETEKKEIISFLKTLTDSSFITKNEFSNPFIK
jgi:cytochrome c peroxidase